MKKARLFLLAALFCLLGSAAGAEWIWRPDVGWINTKEIVKASPQEQFDYGMRLREKGEYKAAARAFQLLLYTFPHSKLAPRAAMMTADSLFKAGYYYSAFLAVKRVIRNYPDSENLGACAKMLYEIGRRFLQGAKREFLGIKLFSGKSSAVEVFEELHSFDPWGEYGDDALLGLGDAWMRLHEYRKAAEIYGKLAAEYPDSPLAPRARLQQAKCYDLLSRSWSHDFLSLSRAMKVLNEIKPDADISEQARALREVIEDRLAHKHYETARFYLRRKKYPAAEIYFLKVMREFPATVWAEKAKGELAKVRKLMAEKKKASAPAKEAPPKGD